MLYQTQKKKQGFLDFSKLTFADHWVTMVNGSFDLLVRILLKPLLAFHQLHDLKIQYHLCLKFNCRQTFLHTIRLHHANPKLPKTMSCYRSHPSITPPTMTVTWCNKRPHPQFQSALSMRELLTVIESNCLWLALNRLQSNRLQLMIKYGRIAYG